jgi:hypothetical protein
MVKAIMFGFIGVVIFQVGLAWYFLAAPASPQSILKGLTDSSSFPLQFWLIALFIFVAVFMTIRNMQKHTKKRSSRW